jgi:hypothetical protein
MTLQTEMVIAVVAAWDFLDECNISVVFSLIASWRIILGIRRSLKGLFGSYTVPKNLKPNRMSFNACTTARLCHTCLSHPVIRWSTDHRLTRWQDLNPVVGRSYGTYVGHMMIHHSAWWYNTQIHHTGFLHSVSFDTTYESWTTAT